MPRILAVDYGNKRVGLAVTDPMQIIATALTTVHSSKAVEFICNYFNSEEVEEIVVGKPVQMDNTPSEIEKNILLFIKKLIDKCPSAKVIRYDERFTSVMAQRTLLEAGLKKQQRQNKALIDKTSVIILLQSYLEHKRNFLKI